MNQQRARRFRTAKDNEIAEEEEKRLREEFERNGRKLLPKPESQAYDSNVITPGTEFMHELSKGLKAYIHRKLNDDPSWRELEVILSDATVPGEGEHKIMSFIRNLRSIPGYDPNTRHCLYGLDADLIMLALATHELHFSILREDVLKAEEQTTVSGSAINASFHKAAEYSSANSSNGGEQEPFFDIRDKKQSLLILPQHYQFLHVWILREYLELDMQIVDAPDKFVFDVERIIDDFIFLCFFVGNDFLPQMPTLDLHENAIDLLMHVYKKEFKNLGGYLVDMQRVRDRHCGYVKLKRVEKFILSVGSYEEQIFKKRAELKERKLRRMVLELSQSQQDELEHEFSGITITDVQCHQNINVSTSVIDHVAIFENTEEFKEKLKNNIRKKSDLFKDGNLASDKVKLGSEGWKKRYYKEKFSVEDPKLVEITRKEILQKYTEGLCWVLLYYFSGIPSWNWYYPYHYGPFASDLKGIAGVKVRFDKGLPFRPFDQLMAVLPPRSAHALPKAYRQLMTDGSSNIIEFYPNDFEVDVDGKRFVWQGICKLPFIDQEQLLNATSKLVEEIELSEEKRNVETIDQLFMRRSSRPLGGIGVLLQKHTENTEEFQATEGEDFILRSNFELPVTRLHIPRLLEGVQPPEKTIFESDIMETVLWHEYMGRPPITRSQAQTWQREVAASDVRKGRTNETSMHKHAGQGWGGAGRGKGIEPWLPEPYNNVNQRNQYQLRYDQRPSPPANNRSYGRATHCTQSSFWPSRKGMASHENLSWRPVSHAKPSSSGDGTERPSPYMAPGNERIPQFMGRGRGRGQANKLNM